MDEDRGALLQGTLELLVLKIVSLEPIHGWGITQRMEQMSDRVFQVNQGSLYPALERLTRRGWLRSESRTTESNRRARYYELTAAGRRRLAVEQEGWARSSGAVNAILAWSGALP
jgi:PadR family transcriptional regulator, regulatory protein PadR